MTPTSSAWVALGGACALAVATVPATSVAGMPTIAVSHDSPSAGVTLHHDDADGLVTPGQRVLFTGKVTHPRAARKVALQRQVAVKDGSREWRTVDQVRRAGKRYRIPERVPRRDLGSALFRVRSATPAGAVTSDPVRLTVARAAGTVGDSDSCASAYREHTNFHNICAMFDNQTHTFLSPGVVVANSANFKKTRFWGDDGWYHHEVVKPGDMGDSTWAFTSAQQSNYAQMQVEFDVQTPAEKVALDAYDGTSDDVSSRCDGGTFTACELNADRGWINGDRMYKLGVDMVNAPLIIRVDNNTGQTVSWRSQPSFPGVSLDPSGSSEDTPGATSIAAGDSYYIAGYRKITGTQAVANLQVSFPDTNHDVNGITHVVNIAGQLTPDTSKGKASTWPVNTGSSSCVDRPVGGDSGLQAPCSLDWSGTGQWGSVATMVVTLNNRF